jgi:hypothetical protein
MFPARHDTLRKAGARWFVPVFRPSCRPVGAPPGSSSIMATFAHAIIGHETNVPSDVREID